MFSNDKWGDHSPQSQSGALMLTTDTSRSRCRLGFLDQTLVQALCRGGFWSRNSVGFPLPQVDSEGLWVGYPMVFNNGHPPFRPGHPYPGVLRVATVPDIRVCPTATETFTTRPFVPQPWELPYQPGTRFVPRLLLID